MKAIKTIAPFTSAGLRPKLKKKNGYKKEVGEQRWFSPFGVEMSLHHSVGSCYQFAGQIYILVAEIIKALAM